MRILLFLILFGSIFKSFASEFKEQKKYYLFVEIRIPEINPIIYKIQEFVNKQTLKNFDNIYSAVLISALEVKQESQLSSIKLFGELLSEFSKNKMLPTITFDQIYLIEKGNLVMFFSEQTDNSFISFIDEFLDKLYTSGIISKEQNDFARKINPHIFLGKFKEAYLLKRNTPIGNKSSRLNGFIEKMLKPFASNLLKNKIVTSYDLVIHFFAI